MPIESAGSQRQRLSPTIALRTVKALHTAVWAFFASCVLAIPVMAWRGNLGRALLLAAIVFAEVLVLAANRLRCPLTGVAARFTDDRSDNFDIYLPMWLARYNKVIFGLLYGAGLLLTMAQWRGWLR
jgi:hypothetical protein